MEETKGKDEQGRIILTDGRLVMGGPWLDRSGYTSDIGDGFRVGVEVIKQGLLDYEKKMPRVKFRDYLRIMKVKIARNYHTVDLPEVNFLEESLWTKDLAKAVVQEIKSSREYAQRQRMVDYVVGEIMGRFEKEKELILPNGQVLVGDLSFLIGWEKDESIGCEHLKVAGKIRDSANQTEQITLLTIKHLSHDRWPGPRKNPRYIKNESVWCKKLEILIVSYLNMLAGFNTNFFCEQIEKIAQKLTERSEWSVLVHKLTQKLLTLDPEAREDEKLEQAFGLIEEVAGLEKK